MRSFLFLLMFVGMALVMHGIYEEKYQRLEKNVRVEYRFIPRTFYEEQMAQTDIAGNFKSMFEKDSPWYAGANRPDVGANSDDVKKNLRSKYSRSSREAGAAAAR